MLSRKGIHFQNEVDKENKELLLKYDAFHVKMLKKIKKKKFFLGNF